MRHALYALGIDLLVQERILFQQRRLLRACAIESNGKSCDQEDDGEDPSCAKEKPAPVRTSLQHALAMHWSYRRICDRKGKNEFIGLGVLHSDGAMQRCPHSRLPKTFERRRADAELCPRSPNSCRQYAGGAACPGGLRTGALRSRCAAELQPWLTGVARGCSGPSCSPDTSPTESTPQHADCARP